MQLTQRILSKADKGQSLTEMAFVLPILLLLFMGIFDTGRMMFSYSQVMNGTREGARFGSVTGLNAVDPQYLQCANIRQAVFRTFALPMDIPDSQIQIQYDDGENLKGFTCDQNPSVNSIESGDRVRVTVTTEFRFLTPFLSNQPIPITFTAARTILKEGTLVPSED